MWGFETYYLNILKKGREALDQLSTAENISRFKNSSISFNHIIKFINNNYESRPHIPCKCKIYLYIQI